MLPARFSKVPQTPPKGCHPAPEEHKHNPLPLEFLFLLHTLLWRSLVPTDNKNPDDLPHPCSNRWCKSAFCYCVKISEKRNVKEAKVYSGSPSELRPWWVAFRMIQHVIVRATITMLKHHDQKVAGEERVYWASFHIVVITEGSQMGNPPRSRPRAKAWCRGHAGVLSTGLLSLLA